MPFQTDTFQTDAHEQTGGGAGFVALVKGYASVHYRMGEASGSVVEAIAGTLNGTVTGTVVRDVAGGLHSSQDDGAIDFDGSTGYVSVADSDLLSPLAVGGEMTLIALVNPTGAVDGSNIVSKAAASNYEWALARNGTVGFQVTIWASGGSSVWSGFTPNSYADSSWWRVIVVVSKGVGRIYVNGTLAVASAWATAAGRFHTNLTSPLNIGRRGDNLYYFNGAVDEVAIIPRAIPPELVTAFDAAMTADLAAGAAGTTSGHVTQRATASGLKAATAASAAAAPTTARVAGARSATSAGTDARPVTVRANSAKGGLGSPVSSFVSVPLSASGGRGAGGATRALLGLAASGSGRTIRFSSSFGRLVVAGRVVGYPTGEGWATFGPDLRAAIVDVGATASVANTGPTAEVRRA